MTPEQVRALSEDAEWTLPQRHAMKLRLDTLERGLITARAHASRLQRNVNRLEAGGGMTPAECVYRVLAELTTRDEAITLGRHHDAAPAAEYARDFCNANDLGSPRESFTEIRRGDRR